MHQFFSRLLSFGSFVFQAIQYEINLCLANDKLFLIIYCSFGASFVMLPVQSTLHFLLFLSRVTMSVCYPLHFYIIIFLLFNKMVLDSMIILKEKFSFNYDAGEYWALKILGKSWKYNLRTKYLVSKKLEEELLQNTPPDVDNVQWSKFIDHYQSDRMKVLHYKHARAHTHTHIYCAFSKKFNRL